MKNPPPLSPRHTPVPFRRPAQKVRLLDKSTSLFVVKKQSSLSYIGTSIRLGRFSWSPVEVLVCPHPTTLPSVLEGLDGDSHKQIGCTFSEYLIFPLLKRKIAMSASHVMVRGSQSSWTIISAGCWENFSAFLKSCAPKIARTSWGISLT